MGKECVPIMLIYVAYVYRGRCLFPNWKLTIISHGIPKSLYRINYMCLDTPGNLISRCTHWIRSLSNSNEPNADNIFSIGTKQAIGPTERCVCDVLSGVDLGAGRGGGVHCNTHMEEYLHKSKKIIPIYILIEIKCLKSLIHQYGIVIPFKQNSSTPQTSNMLIRWVVLTFDVYQPHIANLYKNIQLKYHCKKSDQDNITKTTLRSVNISRQVTHKKVR